MTDLIERLDAPAQAEPTTVPTSLWLLLSNVCDRGKFRVALDVNGVEKELFCQYVHQDDGVVSYGINLTHYIKALRDELAVKALRLELAEAVCEAADAWAYARDMVRRFEISGVADQAHYEDLIDDRNVARLRILEQLEAWRRSKGEP